MQEVYPRVRPDVVFRQEGDESLLFDPVTERVMVLNHTGTLVWQWCDGTRNREEILQKLGEEFGDLDREAAGHDLESFYQELDAMGFLVS